jgi:hypothetical protein
MEQRDWRWGMDDARRTVLMEELEAVKRERDDLNGFIETLARRLGVPVDGGQEDRADAAPNGKQGGASGLLTDDAASLVYEHEFHGMTIPKASETVLSRWSPPPMQRPIKTTQLTDALRKGGLSLDEPRAVYRSLYSAARFQRLTGGLWGLASWYPAKSATPGPATSENDGSAPRDADLPSSTEEGTVLSEEAVS